MVYLTRDVRQEGGAASWSRWSRISSTGCRAAVLVTDLDGVVIYANQQCEVLYAATPSSLMGVDAKYFGPNRTSLGGAR
jgi:PAS domain-containing protein